MKKFKKLLTAALLAATISMPMQARAVVTDLPWLIPTQVQNLYEWASEQAETIGEIVAAKGEILMQMAKEHWATLEAMMSANDQNKAAIQQQTAAQAQLKQGELNYEAEKVTNEAAATAQDKYGSQDEADSMCEAAGLGDKVSESDAGAHLAAKSIASAFLRSRLYVESVGTVIKDRMKAHNDEFCSQEDKDRGRNCVPTDKYHQNADLNASVFMAPANGSTYSEKEKKAAALYMAQTLHPMPVEMLPKAKEATVAGNAYLHASRAAAAQQSVADHTFAQIYASNLGDTALSAATGSGGELSKNGLVKKFVDDYFANPDWKTRIIAMDTNGLLKEMAVLMAGQNWMAYQSYLQGQRMEAVMATELAISAKEQSERNLALIRAGIR